MSAVKHGTPYAYNKGCRCANCTEAKRVAHAKYRRSLGIPERKLGLEHGTQAGYTNHRCRCDECKDAQRRAVAEYRAIRAANVARARDMGLAK